MYVSASRHSPQADSAMIFGARLHGLIVALSLLCLGMGIALGGGIYEGVVLTPVWSAAPPESFFVLQPGTGVPLQTFWIPVHAVLTVAMLGAVSFAWRDRSVRNVILVGLVIYAIMRAWSFAYFIPEMIEFQAIPVDASPSVELTRRVDSWTTWTWGRLPLDLVSLGCFFLALARALRVQPTSRDAK